MAEGITPTESPATHMCKLMDSISAACASRLSAVTANMPAEAQVAPAPGWARSSTMTSCPASASRQPMASPATPAPIMTIFITASDSEAVGHKERASSSEAVGHKQKAYNSKKRVHIPI